MNKELNEFNNKVIEVMKEQNDKENGILLLDLANPLIAVTKLDINEVPSLVFVKLYEDDEKDPKLLVDRIEGVILAISFDNINTYKKMANWMTVIYNKLEDELILNQAIENLV